MSTFNSGASGKTVVSATPNNSAPVGPDSRIRLPPAKLSNAWLDE